MTLPVFNPTPSSILGNIIYGINILTGSLKIDVVGIYDGQTLQQVFANARPLKAFVRESNKVMEYPVETGVTLSDHKITMPKQIEILLIIPARFYASTYQQIANAAINATLLTVQTRAGIYRNMIIESYPHEEDTNLYDAMTMSLRMREVLFVAPSSIAQPPAPAGYSPIDPTNEDTVRRGQQSATEIVAIAGAILGYLRTAQAWGRL